MIIYRNLVKKWGLVKADTFSIHLYDPLKWSLFGHCVMKRTSGVWTAAEYRPVSSHQCYRKRHLLDKHVYCKSMLLLQSAEHCLCLLACVSQYQKLVRGLLGSLMFIFSITSSSRVFSDGVYVFSRVSSGDVSFGPSVTCHSFICLLLTCNV